MFLLPFSNCPFTQTSKKHGMQGDLGGFSLQRGKAIAARAGAGFWGEEKSSLFPPLIFIPLLNEMEVFGCWSSLFLFPYLVNLRSISPLQFICRISRFPPYNFYLE